MVTERFVTFLFVVKYFKYKIKIDNSGMSNVNFLVLKIIKGILS